MDRQQYLKETSEALRKAEGHNNERKEKRPALVDADADGPGAKALKRFADKLREEGLDHDGERWQCPSCRSQSREPEFVLEMRLAGRQLKISCLRDCRPNTIRALLGAPPYFGAPNGGIATGRYPFW